MTREGTISDTTSTDDQSVEIIQPRKLSRNDAARVASYWNATVTRHRMFLSAVTPEAIEASPVMLIRNLPRVSAPSGSEGGMSTAALEKYDRIESELTSFIEEGSDAPVERGAMETAREVMKHLRSRELAPPQLSWLGDDAVLMLWAIGSTRYALTITDGELGYVVRKNRQTVRHDHSIPASRFDLLPLGRV